MIIICPKCQTSFRLPDEQALPGVLLRCSICQEVFPLPETKTENAVTDAPMPGAAPVDGETETEALPDLEDLQKSGPKPAENMHEESVPASGEDLLSLDTEKVAVHPDTDPAPLTFEQENRQHDRHKSSSLMTTLLILVLCLVIALGIVWYVKPDLLRPYLDKLGLGSVVAEKTQPVDLVSKITLSGVRQYSINNEKLGLISVIEGKAVNGFDTPRELIRLEASLHDKDGNTLMTTQQTAGNTITRVQLEVLGEQELTQALDNRIGILSTNTNVPPGGEVPFMVIFFKQPEGATEFGVKVLDAKQPPQASSPNTSQPTQKG